MQRSSEDCAAQRVPGRCKGIRRFSANGLQRAAAKGNPISRRRNSRVTGRRYDRTGKEAEELSVKFGWHHDNTSQQGVLPCFFIAERRNLCTGIPIFDGAAEHCGRKGTKLVNKNLKILENNDYETEQCGFR